MWCKALKDFTDGNDPDQQRGGADRQSNRKVVRQLVWMRLQDNKTRYDDRQLHKRKWCAIRNQLATSMDQSDFDLLVVRDSVHRALTLELSGGVAVRLDDGLGG